MQGGVIKLADICHLKGLCSKCLFKSSPNLASAYIKVFTVPFGGGLLKGDLLTI